ncbi:HPr(Ser) kinase/phosphatase [Candidatus Avelusimicrobium facis]|uniref:HPr(Ser) kinase/phosphatase n=1 Tax=Candidatus Avelusimicrobium facis TaxID=3416203 RepID=UPI003D1141B7
MQPFTKSVTVSELLQVKRLHLELVCGKRYVHREITSSSVNRPGLALCGQLDYFRANSVQVFGRGEHAFCTKEKAGQLKNNIAKMLGQGHVPCVIMAADLDPLPAVRKACLGADVPVLKTKMESAAFVAEFSRYLDERLSPITHVHGVLLNVSGSGVLLRGEAGIGKSECALELIKRGHILVADDVVEVQRRWGRFLVGSCPEMLKHYIEVRGLGILDVELLFGIGSTLDEMKIEMEVELTPPAKNIDRLGLEQKTSRILGVELPSLTIPVTPGRNLAVLIEVAVLNQQLKSQGIFAAKEFSQKMLCRMNKTAKRNGTKA